MERKTHILSDKLLLITTCIFAFCISINFPVSFIPPIIALWLGTILFSIIVNFKLPNISAKENIPYILLIVFYLWSVFTLIYSNNKSQGFNVLESRLLIIILPVFLLFLSNPVKGRSYILLSFLIGNILCILFCFILYYKEGVWGSNSYRLYQFKEIVNSVKHHSYFGLNLTIGLIFLSYLLRNYNLIYKLVVLTLVGSSFLFFIYLSQARMALFLASCCLIIIYSEIISKKIDKRIIIIFFFVITLLLFVVILRNFKSTPKKNIDTFIEHTDNNRFTIWNNSISLIKQSPLIGQGIGDKDVADINSVMVSSHNQILSFLLEGGLISTILFWSSWLWIFFLCIKKKHRFYTLTIAYILLLSMLTESILYRILGVSLFSLIIFTQLKTRENNLHLSINAVNNKFILSILSFFFLITVYFFIKIATKVKLDPINPVTYAFGKHEIIKYEDMPKPLPKEVPITTRGYKLDYTATNSVWSGNSYSYTCLGEPFLSIQDSLYASVYCYVSKNFNGTWVKLSSEGTSEFDNNSFYDLKRKETWQQLTITPQFNEGTIPVYLYFSKYNSDNFNNLSGYVIFAYPTIKIYKP